VVSRSSVTKDTVILRQAYAEAGIAEYWLVNAREQPLVFELLTLHDGRYRNAKRRLGWQHSTVFGRWFRLIVRDGDDGHPEFVLESQTERP
jgi:Uma2 family endonuclease